MKRTSVFFLLTVFAAAFAVHPIVHVDDHDGHACLLTLPGQDAPHATVVLDRPVPLFVGVPPAKAAAGHRFSPTDEHPSRAPPLPL